MTDPTNPKTADGCLCTKEQIDAELWTDECPLHDPEYTSPKPDFAPCGRTFVPRMTLPVQVPPLLCTTDDICPHCQRIAELEAKLKERDEEVKRLRDGWRFVEHINVWLDMNDDHSTRGIRDGSFIANWARELRLAARAEEEPADG